MNLTRWTHRIAGRTRRDGGGRTAANPSARGSRSPRRRTGTDTACPADQEDDGAGHPPPDTAPHREPTPLSEDAARSEDALPAPGAPDPIRARGWHAAVRDTAPGDGQAAHAPATPEPAADPTEPAATGAGTRATGTPGTGGRPSPATPPSAALDQPAATAPAPGERVLRLHDLLAHAPALIAVTFGPTHRLAYVNSAYAAVFGPREPGAPAREALPELDQLGLLPLMDQVLRSGTARALRPRRIAHRPEGPPDTLLASTAGRGYGYYGFVCAPILAGDQHPADWLVDCGPAGLPVPREAPDHAAPHPARPAPHDGRPDRAAHELRAGSPEAAQRPVWIRLPGETAGPTTHADQPATPDVLLPSALLPAPGDGGPAGGLLNSLPAVPAHAPLPATRADGGPATITAPAWRGGVRALLRRGAHGLTEAVRHGSLAPLTHGTPRQGRDGDAVRGVLVFAADMTDQFLAAERLRESERKHRRMAVTLQHSLLPQALEQPDEIRVAATYEPGGEDAAVGGDWYDVITLGAGRTALVIGDVMGRGVRAAAVMGQLRTAVRAYARLDLPPHEVLQLLDGLAMEIDPSQIATCVYAVHDPHEGVLTYASAGHLPPMVRDPDGTVRPAPRAERTPARHRQLDAGHPPACRSRPAPPPSSTPTAWSNAAARDIDHGLTALSEALEGAPGDPEMVCERVLRRMGITAEHDDDVAVLVMHQPKRTGPESELFRGAVLDLLGGPEAAARARAFASECWPAGAWRRNCATRGCRR
ncbi:PAS domain-containing protein [Allostreptomyces psammosilenae]|uniref:PAS domain-containing protein n=1 Tax=Allostreptomyces psammosilenae TaxID=1892865 RepID=A0A852ZS02_9ACTN|nr:PAS domain-containing protein [Allostreptomyces psammosilenae]